MQRVYVSFYKTIKNKIENTFFLNFYLIVNKLQFENKSYKYSLSQEVGLTSHILEKKKLFIHLCFTTKNK